MSVVGPYDPGSSVTLPRRRIPADFVQSLEQRINHIAFGSNPFRLSYFTQEIVFFREDLLKKMQRHSVVTAGISGSPLDGISVSSTNSDKCDVTEQLVQSLLDQAHLFPLPAPACPIIWNLDHTMRLFPLPHLVFQQLVFVMKCSMTPDFLCVLCFCIFSWCWLTVLTNSTTTVPTVR